MSITLHDDSCESEAARLLPWFVTGRLSEADSSRVSRHLEECAICHADVAEQRVLRASLRSEGSLEYAPQAGLATTLARIDEISRDGPAAIDARAPRAARRFAATPWLVAAVVVQAIGLGVLTGALLDRTPARYEVLASPPVTSAPLIRTVFASSMPLGELQRLLMAHNLSIVAGPTAAGVVTLGAADTFSERRLEASLAALRANPHVLFAEPIAPGRPP